MPETLIRADIHVIALDDTRHWTIQEGHKPFIESIHTIVFYNKNEHTHLCEFTPSYCLHHLEYRVNLTPAGREREDWNDIEMERLRETYEQYPVEEWVSYTHCHDIDSIVEQITEAKLEYRHHHYGDPYAQMSDELAGECAGEQDPMETVREDLQSNSVM